MMHVLGGRIKGIITHKLHILTQSTSKSHTKSEGRETNEIYIVLRCMPSTTAKRELLPEKGLTGMQVLVNFHRGEGEPPPGKAWVIGSRV